MVASYLSIDILVREIDNSIYWITELENEKLLNPDIGVDNLKIVSLHPKCENGF